MEQDRYNLARFLHEQETDSAYADALGELHAGAKRGHWMWFVFPQLQLGKTAMAIRLSISGLDEARAYLEHPVLGPRLIEAAEAMLAVPAGRSALSVLGSEIDTMKLRSSATLFAQLSPAGSVFHRILDRFYCGEPDQLTLARL